MNVALMIFSAFITTIGLILITEYVGRREARYFKNFLAFLGIWPILAILLKLLLVTISSPENVSETSTNAAEQVIAMIPENLVSGYIGEVVGFVLWGIYRCIKRFRRYF